jgi:ribose 5-phosphate isomerase B
MIIYFATDHAGFALKETLVPYVRDELGYEVEDCGAHTHDPEDDYPDFIAIAARKVSEDPEHSMAIILGGSGQGEAIVANRFPHVRAVVFNGQYAPKDGREVPHEILTAREHNDANILSLGARFLNEEESKEAVHTFLATPFSGDARPVRRIQKIERLA